jgi:hypothetical protein
MHLVKFSVAQYLVLDCPKKLPIAGEELEHGDFPSE